MCLRLFVPAKASVGQQILMLYSDGDDFTVDTKTE